MFYTYVIVLKFFLSFFLVISRTRTHLVRRAGIRFWPRSYLEQTVMKTNDRDRAHDGGVDWDRD